MDSQNVKSKFIWIVLLLGILAALMSAMENHIDWVASLCGIFESQCNDAARFTILEIPVAFWGIGFYILLITVQYFKKSWLFWFVMAGVGVEITLLQIMQTANLFCIFCIANAFIIVLLCLLVIQQKIVWKSISVCLLLYIISNQIILKENNFFEPQETPLKEKSPVIVAKVGDQEITLEKLEETIPVQLYKKDMELYRLKRAYIEKMIDEMLLQKAAESRNIPVQELINSILEPQNESTDPSTSKDKDFANKKFQDITSQRQKIFSFINSLKKQYKVAIFLDEPISPHIEIDIENSHTYGNKDAVITVVEFSDYLCPACKRAHVTANKIKKMFKDKIKWVFKDFPLRRHKGADKLAEAARCAGEQGKFWEFQDFLFGSTRHPNLNDLLKFAESLSLDKDKFTKCFNDSKYAPNVQQDIEMAKETGIDATPSFVINGQLRSGGIPFEQFKSYINEALSKTKDQSEQNLKTQ